MRVIKNFTLVVINLIGGLWLGMDRKPDFYDNHTITKTKIGYMLFVTLSALIAIGTVIWLYMRIY